MSIESVMPSNHLILCRPLLLPSIFSSIRVFPNESALHTRWPNIGVLASASVLPMNIQDWFPLGWTVGSPCCPRDSQESSPTPLPTSIILQTEPHMVLSKGFSPPSPQGTLPFISPSQRTHFSSLSQIIIVIKILFDYISLIISYF